MDFGPCDAAAINNNNNNNTHTHIAHTAHTQTHTYNTEIEIKTNITTLGVILDKHLTLNTQISSIVKQCNNKQLK